VEYDLLPQLTLAGDARYQSDTVKDTTMAGERYSKTVDNVLPRVSLRFKPNDATMTYMSYAEGVQPLALNSGYLNATAAGKTYLRSQVPSASDYTPQPKLKSFEVGIKQALFNNRVNYALTAYNQLWLNRATNTLVFNPDSCSSTDAGTTDECPLSVSGSSLTYGNKARIWGVEFSADAALTRQWNAGLNVDFKHARWEEFRSAGSPSSTGDAVEFSGNALGKIPTITWAFNTTYRMPLPNGWMGFARGDVVYTGSAWDSDFNIVKTDSYTRVNTRFGAEKGPVSLELFVKNLFDDKHWDYAYRVSDLSLSPLTSFSNQGLVVQAPDRREVGVRVRYAFD
jgi:iron complex outermembrane recepter protein